MDKLTWFKFSPSDWMMGKISKLPLKIQAEYIRFICTYWNKKCIMSEDDAKLEFSDQAWDKLNQYKLLNTDGDYVSILFLDKQMESINDISIKRSEAGKKSAEIRAKKNTSLTSAEQNPTEKKRKEKNIYRSFAHLSINLDDYTKLVDEFGNDNVIETLDSIENYKKNTNYKSLYLTARSWLKKQTNVLDDSLYNNVMKQINDK
tara:strand:+ start:2460 stop:3071 length:612 start_codon:yes stop_codon:yes gene_type:complete